MALPNDDKRNSKPDLATRPGDVYRRLAQMVDHGQEGVLATVVATHLSAPRRAGSKMIVHDDGSVTGTIGGGSAEAMVIQRAVDVMASGECQTVSVDLKGSHGVCGGSMEIFLEAVQRANPFLVIGAGHVGQALVTVGRSLRFRFTVVDDRPEYLAQLDSVSGVKTLLATPAELADKLSVPRRGAVLVCSRNHQLDAEYLEALLRLEIAGEREYEFFGSLGSRAKAARLRSMLSKKEDLANRMAAVRLPVGIDIGAETPAEIALSVLAEAQAVLRGIKPVMGPDGTQAFPVHGKRR